MHVKEQLLQIKYLIAIDSIRMLKKVNYLFELLGFNDNERENACINKYEYSSIM